MHPCQQCGYESPASARFCRQCGAPFFVETEVSTAATRNYGAPAVATPSSGHLPPSIADALAGETERYYQPPPSPAPPIANTAPIKSKRRIWRWLFLVLVLFIGVVFGAMINEGLDGPEQRPLPPEVRAQRQEQQEAQRRERERRRESEQLQRQAQERARETQERAREAIDRAREAAEQASQAGAMLATTNEKPLDLSTYEYPNITTANAIRIAGHEMLTLRTSDDLTAVSQFYQKKLGKPVIEVNESREKRLLFQANTAPPISVSVETDPERQGQLKIVVLRSPFRFPQLAENPNPK